jgi:ribose-phosphate pyrophosphokinase
MKIMTGTAHRSLAAKIAEFIGQPLADVEVDAFPDGETDVKINENVRGEDVFIIQPSCPPTNHNIMELLIMVDAARRASAERITAVMPFFGYARQDRKDQPRVPITAKLVADLLSAAGMDRILTMELHAGQIQAASRHVGAEQHTRLGGAKLFEHGLPGQLRHRAVQAVEGELLAEHAGKVRG